MSRNWMVMVAAGAVAAGMALVGTSLSAQTGGGNAQLLWGGDFRDASVGNATADGEMATLTLEHLGGWALGDHFFFIDMTTGHFEAEGVRGYRMYSEWTPRLSLSRATGRSLAAGIVGDVLLVGEVHAGSGGYAAGLFGGGVDLRVPGFAVLSLSALRRDDVFNAPTWQASGVWVVPFSLGLEGALTGFVDVIGTPDGDPLVMTQPQLLIELGPLVGTSRRDVQVGVEWYLHRDGESWHSVPQLLVRWAW